MKKANWVLFLLFLVVAPNLMGMGWDEKSMNFYSIRGPKGEKISTALNGYYGELEGFSLTDWRPTSEDMGKFQSLAKFDHEMFSMAVENPQSIGISFPFKSGDQVYIWNLDLKAETQTKFKQF